MPKLYPIVFIATLFACNQVCAQATAPADTAKKLNEVSISGFFSNMQLIAGSASVSTLSGNRLSLQPDNSLVTAMNTLPGVRMEERSPGSYRLSIRGSLLRSPFGIRDVKIYFDEMPLTDAGGNTYLNSIDMTAIQGIEVLKGPNGSLYGANSGGVVLVSPNNKYTNYNYSTFGFNGGSYGLLHENSSTQAVSSKNTIAINQAVESYDGYRANSAMNRDYVQVYDKWLYTNAGQLKVMGFYSDLNYKTPGGLTLAQYQADPSSARLATPAVASAQALNASIHNQMVYGGVVNQWQFSHNLSNVLTVFGSHVNFTNPSFTVYEERREATYGFRTYFELENHSIENLTWKADAGYEWQQTNSNIGDYGNHLGNKDTTQTRDNININQNFLFARLSAIINHDWQVEGSLSLNSYQYQFQNLYPNNESGFTNRPFNAQLMPRLALSYNIRYNLQWRASVSRGYSTPTSGEVHATDHIINPNLQAQDGWNYETGLRFNSYKPGVQLDVAAFYYRLNNAIVMRQHPNGTSYYVNAGGTNQPGIEVSASWWLWRHSRSFVQGLQLTEGFTYDHFRFSDYQDATTNYNGNNLTGVPPVVAVTGIYLLLPQSFYLFAQHNYTARLPLNDANTAYADSYHLITAKAGWNHNFGHSAHIELFAGVDNLLNRHYSLGNDLNAAASRYYNAAALRNFYGGIRMSRGAAPQPVSGKEGL
ncbi:TonB-dependent receptor [Mucilaginibacter sp. PPCGB 2223]|uniref:TonB-dependent receptor n=1 Tax=Mucilaginibacter sp. PPCGB 2223 TaxID=1886027 RepID=UPI000824274B|nr:TonB-dependent receptor [Mucilaginibacter sp. PPCGB 2223]OCX54687.1 TonB-dependent receptor [Mucilaginibacter sp. PPCGB 2223]